MVYDPNSQPGLFVPPHKQRRWTYAKQKGTCRLTEVRWGA